jgi:hypothetical protein
VAQVAEHLLCKPEALSSNTNPNNNNKNPNMLYKKSRPKKTGMIPFIKLCGTGKSIHGKGRLICLGLKNEEMWG